VTDRSEAAPSGENESCVSASTSTSATQDDMIDMPSDFQRWPFLYRVLGECRDSLVALYLKSDRAALDAQRVHRFWVLCAAVAATLAVCLAIVQLTPLKHISLSFVEAGAVGIAVLAFWQGEKSREKWLTERHKAERCRLLKFGSIIRPDRWTVGGLSSVDCASEIGAQAETVGQMCFEDVTKWLKDDTLASPPGRISSPDLKELADLREYYRQKRAEFQVQYFQKQFQSHVERDDFWRKAPHWLFKVSVKIVLVHAALEVAKWLAERKHVPLPGFITARWFELFLDGLIALAALLPVFGSGIRISRSAHEATRNMSRFGAKYYALDNIGGRLKSAKLNDAAEAESLLRDLWCAEQIMESEHREWLRLMMGAEWVG
jgi:hypothetical protein